MSTIPLVPTILLAQEDPDAASQISALILDFFPSAKLKLLTDFPALTSTLACDTPVSLLLTDIFWSDANQSNSILLLADAHPEIPFGIVSRYDLTQTLPPAFPIPWLKTDDQLPLAMAGLMENFSGRTFGPYTLLSPAGPHPLGRLYWAKHQQLERQVQILVPTVGSTQFSKSIRTCARLNHPSVYSLYESVPYEQRILVALEPVIHPSLLQMQNQEANLPLIAGSRLATALASVLSEMESSHTPARLLGPYDYTLSPTGTPRLRNPTAGFNTPETSHHENSNHLASILETQLSPTPVADSLLEILRNPGTSAFDLLRQTRNFERQLAEVQDVHVRDEEIEATKKIFRARILRRWTIALGSLGAVAFLALGTWIVHQALFRDLPGTLGHEEILVPAGRVILADSTNSVSAFYLDRHEVTIGQYEKFLKEISAQENWKTFLPPAAAAGKTSLEDLAPPGWKDILQCARKGGKYNGQVTITRDTPVFFVDYPSAFAYAKWNKRRLPTKIEWLRAATGNDNRTYPWGNQREARGINLGLDLPKNISPESYDHMLPAESHPADIGPFQHYDLGGNVSEWIASPNPMTPLFLGGNFKDTFPVSNLDLARGAPKGAPCIGFRTAR